MKMKHYLTLAAALTLSATSMGYPFGSSPRGERVRELPQHVQELIQWCQEIQPTLSRALARAERLANQEQYTAALRTLTSGMRNALADRRRNLAEETLSGRMLRRGLTLLSRELEPHFPDSTNFRFARSWVRFVMRTSLEVDQHYYIPYHHHWDRRCEARTGCNSRDRDDDYEYDHDDDFYDERSAEMHEAYMNAIEGQLEILEREMFQGHAPIGGPQFFLTLVEEIVYDILNEDFSPERNTEVYSHACAASRLGSLLEDIRAYRCDNDACEDLGEDLRSFVQHTHGRLRNIRLMLHQEPGRCSR